MARGAVPNGLRSTVARTAPVTASSTMRLSEAELATYSVAPVGESATAIGPAPTEYVVAIEAATRLTTDTVPSPALATYAYGRESTAMLVGLLPTGSSATLTICGCRRKIDTVLI